MPGHLFTEYFLTDGIRQTPERQSQRPAFNTFHREANRLFQDFPTSDNPNESQTEQDLIRPRLQRLGWTDDLPQAASGGGEKIPDLLLFRDAEAKTRATSSETSLYLEALAVAELIRYRHALDVGGPGKEIQAFSLHVQIPCYLATVSHHFETIVASVSLLQGACFTTARRQNRTALANDGIRARIDFVTDEPLRRS